MDLWDVNVLVYAHRTDLPEFERFRPWLEEQVNAERSFGLSDLVLSGFLRVVTNPRAFSSPTPPTVAMRQADALRARPNRVAVTPGSRHWAIFSGL